MQRLNNYIFSSIFSFKNSVFLEDDLEFNPFRYKFQIRYTITLSVFNRLIYKHKIFTEFIRVIIIFGFFVVRVA